MAFQTQNSIKNVYCLEGGSPGRRVYEKAGPGLGQEPSGKTAAYALQSVGNKTETQLLRWEGKKQIFFFLEVEGASQMLHPSTSTSTGPFVLGVDFIPRQMDGRIRSSPHYTPLLRSL